MFKKQNRWAGDYFEEGITPVASSTEYTDNVLDVNAVQGQVKIMTEVATALTIGSTGMTLVYQSSANGSTGWTTEHSSAEVTDTVANGLAVGDIVDEYVVPSDVIRRYWRVGVTLAGTYTGGTLDIYATYMAR